MSPQHPRRNLRWPEIELSLLESRDAGKLARPVRWGAVGKAGHAARWPPTRRVLLPLGVAREKRLRLIASKVGDCRAISRGEGPYCTSLLENAQYLIKQFGFH
jgi:hypothetical protein